MLALQALLEAMFGELFGLETISEGQLHFMQCWGEFWELNIPTTFIFLYSRMGCWKLHHRRIGLHADCRCIFMPEPIAWRELWCQEIPLSRQPSISFTTVNLLLASTITTVPKSQGDSKIVKRGPKGDPIFGKKGTLFDVKGNLKLKFFRIVHRERIC